MHVCASMSINSYVSSTQSQDLFPAANNTSLGLDTSTSSGMLTSCWDITLHHNTTWDESLTNAAGAVLYTMKMQLKHFYSNSFHFISCCVIPCHFMSQNYKKCPNESQNTSKTVNSPLITRSPPLFSCQHVTCPLWSDPTYKSTTTQCPCWAAMTTSIMPSFFFWRLAGTQPETRQLQGAPAEVLS